MNTDSLKRRRTPVRKCLAWLTMGLLIAAGTPALGQEDQPNQKTTGAVAERDGGLSSINSTIGKPLV